ncbi:MAG: AIM24 family protein [Candidatus Dormibacteria bacterium]
MTTAPKLHPTGIRDAEGPGIRYHIEGELVPVLHVEMTGQVPIYFEHHVLLWKQPQVDVRVKQLKGVARRMLAGMQVFVTEAVGAGEIAFSRDMAGQVFPLTLEPGRGIEVREHQFLAATGNIDYSYFRLRGVSNMLFGGTGIFIDRFIAEHYPGVLWLHGYGNVFEKDLAPGEVIDVEPGGWVYKDVTVQMQVQVMGLKSGIFAGAGNLVFNRFTGPGRVGIQSAYYHLPTAE